MDDQTQHHNRAAPAIVESIVRPVIEAGGHPAEIMVLLESVVVGTCLAVVRLGGDNKVLDVVIERARQRLAEIRLADIDTAGRG